MFVSQTWPYYYCHIFHLILVNWGDFFSLGDIKFMAFMLKGAEDLK